MLSLSKHHPRPLRQAQALRQAQGACKPSRTISEVRPGARRTTLRSGRQPRSRAAPPPAAPATPPEARLTVTDVRRLWPEVLEEVKGKRRFTWILLSQNAQVTELRDNTLLLAMSNAGARDSFGRGGSEDVLREAIVVVLGADFKIETMVDPSASPGDGTAYASPGRARGSRPRADPARRSRRPGDPRTGPAEHPTDPNRSGRSKAESRRTGRGRPPRRQRPRRRGGVARRPAGPPPRRGDHHRRRVAHIGWAREPPTRSVAMIPEGDMSGLLAQAQAMQEQLFRAQEELAETQVQGSAGGDLVTATVTGAGELVGLVIKPEAVDRGRHRNARGSDRRRGARRQPPSAGAGRQQARPAHRRSGRLALLRSARVRGPGSGPDR